MADILMCMESTGVRRAYEDSVLLDDDRVLENLLSAEEHYVPRTSYFSCIQTDINAYMRRVVTEWMQEVCEEQNTEEEVFSLSVNYMDRFLCVQNIHRTRLQCLAAACMFIASKLKENNPIPGDQLVMYTDHSITLRDLREMELMVLQVLKWDLSAITPYDFVSYIVHRLGLDPRETARVKKNAESFVKHCAIESKFMLYTPSMIASGCICVAFLRMESLYSIPSLLQRLHKITGIDLQPRVKDLLQVQPEALGTLSLFHQLRKAMISPDSSGRTEQRSTEGMSGLNAADNGREGAIAPQNRCPSRHTTHRISSEGHTPVYDAVHHTHRCS